MAEVTFASPEYLWLLFVIPIIIIIHFLALKSTKRRAMRFANFEAIERITGGEVLSKNLSLLFVRVLILILLAFALAGTTYWYTGQASNFDFVLAIDASNSMLADDFAPNRLESAKEAAKLFIDTISHTNKIAVTSFSSTVNVNQALTEDFLLAKQVLNDIKTATTGGTALGDAIITSTNLLLQSNRSRAVILLTDGQSNTGSNIEDAIEYANLKLTSIYTIGIGTEEGGVLPETDIVLKLDEETLKIISLSTEGAYFKAADKESLKQAYQKIASVTESRIGRNLTLPFMLIALILLIGEWVMFNTKYRTIP
ncbi:MAG: VWA domain-containing protein [Nanoarchaeota archaeon]